MGLVERSLDRHRAQRAHLLERELASRSSDEVQSFDEWFADYRERVIEECCGRCNDGWKAAGDYICAECRGFSSTNRWPADHGEKTFETSLTDADRERLGQLDELVGRERMPAFGSRFDAVEIEVEECVDLPDEHSAHVEAREIFERLNSSPALRQALLPLLFRETDSCVSDWHFIWDCLEREYDDRTIALNAEWWQWQAGAPRRAEERWDLIKDFLEDEHKLDAKTADEAELTGLVAEMARRAPTKGSDQMSQPITALEEAHDETTEPTPEPGVVWLDSEDDIDVLWKDAEGVGNIARGRFKGLTIPEGDIGGPVEFVVDGPDGESSIHAEDLVGISRILETAKVAE